MQPLLALQTLQQIVKKIIKNIHVLKLKFVHFHILYDCWLIHEFPE
jgi:hypothetical protein